MKTVILASVLAFVSFASETLRKYCIPVLVAIALWYILLFIAKRGGDPIPRLHCYLFSGSMGSGKSYCSQSLARSFYGTRRVQNAVYRIFFGWKSSRSSGQKLYFPKSGSIAARSSLLTPSR